MTARSPSQSNALLASLVVCFCLFVCLFLLFRLVFCRFSPLRSLVPGYFILYLNFLRTNIGHVDDHRVYITGINLLSPLTSLTWSSKIYRFEFPFIFKLIVFPSQIWDPPTSNSLRSLLNFFETAHKKLDIYNNYSPKWRWLVQNIYRTAKQWGKYPRLATYTEVNNCFSIY